MRILTIAIALTAISTAASAQGCPQGVSQNCWDTMLQRQRNGLLQMQLQQQQQQRIDQQMQRWSQPQWPNTGRQQQYGGDDD